MPPEPDATTPSHSPWEAEAANWLAWARTPGHDVFPDFSPVFLDEIVPAPAGLTLEAGCGEGRVARELAARGHRVVALDVSPTLVRHAREADGRPAYVAGDATALPFADAAFQTVVAYNSLQTMRELDDMARAVGEVARVLPPSGRFCFCVAHPMTDVGRLRPHPAGGDAVAVGSYFENELVRDAVTRDGLEMTFHGWTYTLQDYARALEDAGLVIERLREPTPSADQVARHPDLARWRQLPMFLSIRAVKREPGPP